MTYGRPVAAINEPHSVCHCIWLRVVFLVSVCVCAHTIFEIPRAPLDGAIFFAPPSPISSFSLFLPISVSLNFCLAVGNLQFKLIKQKPRRRQGGE